MEVMLMGGCMLMLVIAAAIFFFMRKSSTSAAAAAAISNGNSSMTEEIPKLSIVLGELATDAMQSQFFSTLYPYATVQTKPATQKGPLAPGAKAVIMLYTDASGVITAVDAVDAATGPSVPGGAVASNTTAKKTSPTTTVKKKKKQ